MTKHDPAPSKAQSFPLLASSLPLFPSNMNRLNTPTLSKWTFIAFAFLILNQMQQATAQVIFEDDFNTGSINSPWIARPNLSGTNGIIEVAVDWGVGGTGDYALRMGKSSNQGGFTTNAIDLPLNLSGKSNVELVFQIRHLYDETQLEDGLYFSDNNGATFKKALDFRPSDWCLGYGQFPPIQVSKIAQRLGLNSASAQFVIRFQQRGDWAINNDGFVIDEVKVYTATVEYQQVTPNSPACESFETGAFSNSWAWRSAEQTSIVLSGGPITRISGDVRPVNGLGFDGSAYGLLLGKNCNDGFTTQAADWHLDLSAVSQAELTFWIQHYYDDTHLDDGIYFSDDGGNSFEKVFDFEPSDWCVNQYGKLPSLDIDQLAKSKGLNLTSTFVIRFQQRGENGTYWGSYYGFKLDDICVSVPDEVYAPLPFVETFELGDFRNMWAPRFADQTTVINTGVPSTRPSNILDVRSGIGRNLSTYAVAMGKSCNDGFATNALDLQLNLENQSNVVMTCWIMDLYDDTHLDDGIYFSNNAGRTFTKVKDFDFTNTANQYTQYQLDVSGLASANTMALTDSFIIRFQQHGELALGNDGIYLDDISVTGTSTTSNNRPQVALLNAYPNPTSDFLTVALPEAREFDLALYDLQGRKLDVATSVQGLEARLDLSSLPAGVYQLRVLAGQLPYRLPVVKQ